MLTISMVVLTSGVTMGDGSGVILRPLPPSCNDEEEDEEEEVDRSKEGVLAAQPVPQVTGQQAFMSRE